ncbi:asparaginyl-tRNA synthetase [Neohortaea acidophila]|uniref:asparagine--tRNA ligase n=1 Tax=Neohortaea acidophila TaxID=245834 RepID=A0A6A6PQ88_9PEZI|nr:asparaginyl-tRNA synthetase [Neohortaea acidophila]KAF2481966.1 asparaginyl-tRNA synthetase [Neohortaea acidophila]
MRTWRTAHRSLRSADPRRHRAFSASVWPCGRRSTADLLQHGADEENVCVTGWVRTVRKQKRVAFAAVSDGSTVHSIQAVLKPEDAANLSTGTAVELNGDWKASSGAKQSHELHVSRLKVLGENDAQNHPVQQKYQTAEYLRTIPHLRARIPANTLLLRLRSELIAAVTDFFNRQDFVQTHTPIITSSDCEGAGEVFTVSSNTLEDASSKSESVQEAPAEHHFFRQPKFLTVSAQLHLEALAQAVTKVWTLSPTFRAERSDTPRHLSEFYMLEAEVCFVQDLNEIMDLVEAMLRSAVSTLAKSRVAQELLEPKQQPPPRDPTANNNDSSPPSSEILQQRWNGIIAPDWPRITYAEAIQLLEEAHASRKNTTAFHFPPSYADGLQAEHERYLASTIGQGKPVFVTHYPAAQKPFYMSPSTDSDTVACFDLLVPDLCELAGGSLREHRSEELQAAMRGKGVAGENLEWYHNLRRFGSVPHGGFGLGFDRLLCYLSGVGNVRDVVAFPRWFGRCEC